MDYSHLKYQTHKSKMSNFFNDLIEFKLNYDRSLEVSDYNMFSKVMVNYFNSGVFNEFIGGKYKLAKHMDQDHYAMYSTDSNSPINNLYLGEEFYEAINNKYAMNGEQYVDQIRDFIAAVENTIHDANDNYIQRRKKYLPKMEVVDYTMNESELKFQESFYQSGIGNNYNVNFKNQNIKTLIQDKLNQDAPVQTVFCKNFGEHYTLLKKTLPYELYPEYIGSPYAFDKQCHFMHDELELLYIPCKTDQDDRSRNIDNTWILLHQNNRYAGGVVVANSAVNEVRHISMKSSIASKETCKKIIDDLLSSNLFSQTIFMTAPEIARYSLQDELRNEYKNRPLYFTQKEKHAYFILESFIELNELTNQSEKIKNDFYKNIIVKHDKLLNAGDLFEYSYSLNESPIDLLMDKFKLDVLKKYKKFSNMSEVIDRETFIRRCFISQKGEDDYKYYLQNDYRGNDFAFRLPLDGNGTTDLLNIVKDFLLNQNIPYTHDVYKGVYESIKNHQQIAIHNSTDQEFLTYSYHSLYETLSDLGCIKTNQEPCYVFRLEMTDGKGVYISDNSDSDIVSNNDANILEYDQRKIPQRDRGLSTLFIANDSEVRIRMDYANNYHFAFTSKEQMLSWFSKPELTELANLGTRLYRCEIPEVNVIASQVQVAFNTNKLISKVELNLNEFLDIEMKNEIDEKPLRNNKIKM